MKVFNARLSEEDMEQFVAKAHLRGLSLTALLRRWIREEEGRTKEEIDAWIARNLGNKRLHVHRVG
ncbi:MAG TPA: hypothetical protein VHC86_01670 [Opitutaceae bacterium]|nr:hypothetical protein [Opitutaceae bacterium]